VCAAMQNLTNEQYAVCGDNIADVGDAGIYLSSKVSIKDVSTAK